MRANLHHKVRILDEAVAQAVRLSARFIQSRQLPDKAVSLIELCTRSKLSALTAALRSLQGEHPLIHPVVDGQAIAEVVGGWTGSPAGRMRADEIRTVLALKERLERRIFGQPHALEAVAQAIHTSHAKVTDPRKPIGEFLMVGTSGVGKAETALALADPLYGGERNVTMINMSEFKEEDKVS